MERNFQKYKDIIKVLITEKDVNKYILSSIFDLGNIKSGLDTANHGDKVRMFLEFIEQLESPNKYVDFIKLTEETTEWIKVFLEDSPENEQYRINFDMSLSLLQLQQSDHKESLNLNHAILFNCLKIDLISELQHSKLKACLDDHGLETAKINFLLQICFKSKDWYGKLLYVHYITNCDFISRFLPDLEKTLKNIKGDTEKREYIFSYGNSIIEHNISAFSIDNSAAQCSNVSAITPTEKDTLNRLDKWLTTFLTDDPRGSDKIRENWQVVHHLMKIQVEDHINSLTLDESVLFQSRHIGLITHRQFEGLVASLKNDGKENAKIKFLSQIIDNPGWYGKLLYIYDSTKCNFIPDYLEELQKDLDLMESDEEKRDLLFAYGNSIIDSNLKAFPVQQTASKCSNDIDMDCIRRSDIIDQLESTRVLTGNISIPQPLPNFTSIVTREGSHKADLADHSDDSSTSDDCYEENSDIFNDLFGRLVNKDVRELLHFNMNQEQMSTTDDKRLIMRKYQRELATQGIKGNNVLICSPTGSGKTVVAVKIVQEHLKITNNAKVAFLVHRIALVEQQYNQFCRYLKCRITQLSGSAKSSGTPLVGHLESFDVFVLTSDILKNALEEVNETHLKSINAFTLILFDECHNCDKKHPYNRIMTHYFKDKKAGRNVPQIIGLTASTGTNKAKTMDKALKRLYTLCANLDTHIVSTVKQFKDELDNVQSKPVEEILTPPSRSSDKFDNELQSQMELCERMLRQMNARDFFPKDANTQALFNIPEDRLHQKYSGFVGKLKTELYNNTKEDKDGKKALFAIASYLNAFVRALMVNHLFRATDAVKLIQNTLDLTGDNPVTCEVERILKRKLSRLSGYTQEEISENPSLICLKKEIKTQIEADSQSRIIVFVRERIYTDILKIIFSSELSSIKCDTITGNSISAEQGGLTQSEMEEVLGRFRRGDINVLFATTVAEEGLDIQKCNLVIRYGHVTNETAMVQSRGRARAANSKYIVIVPHKLQWQVNKENINKYRETMMYRAIAKFQEMDEDAIMHEIEECQYERELQETCIRMNQQTISTNQRSSDIWYFNCKKCSQHICKSSDIRLAEGAHHIVINEECFQYMSLFPKNANSFQIKCGSCSSLLGNRQNYRSRLFPTLKIESFSLLCEGQTQSRSFKKWKDVPFAVAECSSQELLNFKQNHSLAM